MEKPKFIVFDKRETLFESVGKDVITFGFLFLCIYVSHGSLWWTFLTGVMFLLFLASKMPLDKERVIKIYSKAELQALVDSL